MEQINFKDNKPFMDWLQKNKPMYYSVLNSPCGINNNATMYNLILHEFECWLDEINAEISTKLLLKDLGVLTF